MEYNKYKEFVETKYNKEGMSFGEIGKILDKHPNTIRRDFIKWGNKSRTKSEAQANVLFWGKAKHPTKGKKRTDEEKQLISENMAKMWEDMDDTTRDKRKAKAKRNWDKMGIRKKEELRHKAAVAIRRAATEGSKMEKLMIGILRDLGYPCIMHEELMLLNGNMQIDIYVPKLRLAIEIDGPTHFMPIWGEEKLAKKVNADNEKNGLLLADGYSIVRFKHLVKKITAKYTRQVKELLESKLSEFEKNSSTPTLYHLEV